MFELEELIGKKMKDGIISMEGVTVYVRVKLKDYKLSNDKRELSIDVNLNEFVDSLSKKLGITRITNLMVLCNKKLKELYKE